MNKKNTYALVNENGKIVEKFRIKQTAYTKRRKNWKIVKIEK